MMGERYVPGDGPCPCASMIVGEAPGMTEDATGKPFVGESGKLLEETLLRLGGISRRHVYITNVVKRMPLTDDGRIRPPELEEVRTWLGILRPEVSRVQPRAILALGRVARYALTNRHDIPFGGQGITRGEVKPVPVHVAWHPSYILRKGRSNYDLWIAQLEPWVSAVYDWL